MPDEMITARPETKYANIYVNIGFTYTEPGEPFARHGSHNIMINWVPVIEEQDTHQQYQEYVFNTVEGMLKLWNGIKEADIPGLEAKSVYVRHYSTYSVVNEEEMKQAKAFFGVTS